MLTDAILSVLLVVGLASYGTSVTCRLALVRHRRFTWRSGIFGPAIAAPLSIAFMFLGLSMQPGQLPYFDEFLGWMLAISFGGGLFGVFPAEVLVWYYNWHQRDSEHMAEQRRRKEPGDDGSVPR